MSLKLRPSCFRMLENTTHLAGMLTPCACRQNPLTDYPGGEAYHCEGFRGKQNLDEPTCEQYLYDLSTESVVINAYT